MAAYNSYTDNELFTLMQKGEEDAFTELYNRHWKYLYITANNIIQRSDAAQDAVQEVFISFWLRRYDLKVEFLKAYLQQATRFQVLKAIRARKTDERFYDRLAAVTLEIFNEDPILFKEQQQLLNQLLDTLPEDCKETFRLSREEHLTYRQIAEQLNISEKTVEKRVSKSLNHIRAGLNLNMYIVLLYSLQQLP